ncbi:MAG: hypothetical protein PHQ98_01205 [Candidatus ainarchaeum sp.]|nr:hypothetical protein [Candidatus ainarchaeum sp.]
MKFDLKLVGIIVVILILLLVIGVFGYQFILYNEIKNEIIQTFNDNDKIRSIKVNETELAKDEINYVYQTEIKDSFLFVENNLNKNLDLCELIGLKYQSNFPIISAGMVFVEINKNSEFKINIDSFSDNLILNVENSKGMRHEENIFYNFYVPNYVGCVNDSLNDYYQYKYSRFLIAKNKNPNSNLTKALAYDLNGLIEVFGEE